MLAMSFRRARASRLWKRYLRVAAAVAGVLGTAILTIMYFVLLAPFAWLAKRAERHQPDDEGDSGGQVDRAAHEGGGAEDEPGGDPERHEECHGVTSQRFE